MINLTHNSFLCIYLFQFSTCFEQPRAHHQENQLYQYNLWYVTLWRCPFRVRVRKDLHKKRSRIQLIFLTMSTWLLETC